MRENMYYFRVEILKKGKPLVVNHYPANGLTPEEAKEDLIYKLNKKHKSKNITIASVTETLPF